MIYFDSQQQIHEKDEIEELTGKLSSQEERKLMHSVLENDKETIEKGKLIRDSINQGLDTFTPDLIYQQLVKNYSMAKHIFGPSLLKLATGYNPDYIEKNINIPEFQKELRFRIQKNIEKLKEEGLLDRDSEISEKGIELASLVMYFEELDKITPKGILGGKIHKKTSIYGGKEDIRTYKKSDRYKDIAIKKSVKLAIRRGHKKLHEKDLKVFERQSKGQSYIVYALDASGSMKGSKIDACKRAGIALAYKAIDEKDKVGLIVFGSEIKTIVEPTQDFSYLLKNITSAKASRETDLAVSLRKSIELFPNDNITKHLILITDALPTIGKEPEQETLQEVSIARNKGITISLIGINLNEKGKKLAKKITELGEGKLYIVKNIENIDKIVLEDYYGIG
ncbi:MAG TPA: VWA domain-containing protein [Candidatus Woesearchaeota archaeon]|nr:VWA domain-containing protein [Candidatus Woesearchaeota archaeon]HJO01956.1 VWA domain-containing protein [Candidatus Woesearchaeota archaeon]